MVRLLAVRASIATLKRAISLSYRLNPATWEFLAICCAGLFVLSAWGLRESQQQHVHPDLTTITPQIVAYEWETSPNAQQSFAVSISGVNFQSGFVFLDPRDHLALHGHVSLAVGTSKRQNYSISPGGSRTMSFSAINPLMTSYRWRSNGSMASSSFTVMNGGSAGLYFARLRLTNAEDSRFALQFPTLPNPARFFRQAPTVIIQSVLEEGGSFGKEVMFWVSLFVLFLSPITGFGMMSIAWLSHHRKRGEQTLLQLQIIKLRLENENITLVNEKLRMELALLARQEVDKPRIISG